MGGSVSPILIDTTREGFQLTDASDGVWFDMFGRGVPVHISWTTFGSRNGWLALDRNANGTIDSGQELFGNVTPQPASPSKNGFLALGVYDKPQNGGNGDGVLDARDAIYAQLRVWIDESHDGVSQSNELHTLGELGIRSIDLDYKRARRVDQFGNQFEFRAKVTDMTNFDVGRWAWDVFLKYL